MGKIKEYIRTQFDLKELLLGYTDGYPSLVLAIVAVVLILVLLVGTGILVSIILG